MNKSKALKSALLVVSIAWCAGLAAQGVDWYQAWVDALRQKDTARAAILARDAAGQGDLRGKYAYAIMLRDGVGMPRDSTEARRLMGEAAAAGVAAAANDVGLMAMRGIGGPVDLDAAHDHFSRAAEQGHAEAMYHLSSVLGSPSFTRRDAIASFAAAHRSALAGHVPAYSRIGFLMLRGEGVTKDAERAVEWLKQGAEKGDRQSTAYLGWALVTGTGIGRNAQTGERLLITAANTGNLWAMGTLSELYRQGTVLSRDYARAYIWATVALGQGSSLATLRTARDELEKQLSPDQIASAQREARQWTLRTAQTERPAGQAPAQASPASNGSAFFVSSEGHAVTNYHVIKGCRRLSTAAHGDATVVFQDVNADLAVVRSQTPSSSWAKFRPDSPRLGEAVYAFGFPLYGRLSTGGNFTAGVISSMIGSGNNPSQIQITAQIQPGNSGGAVLDQQGRVVGVAVATLKSDAAGGAVVPQNVNFAVNGLIARTAVESIGVRTTLARDTVVLRPDEVAEIAKQFSTVLQCFQ